jgi:hypothetical protein
MFDESIESHVDHTVDQTDNSACKFTMATPRLEMPQDDEKTDAVVQALKLLPPKELLEQPKLIYKPEVT